MDSSPKVYNITINSVKKHLESLSAVKSHQLSPLPKLRFYHPRKEWKREEILGVSDYIKFSTIRQKQKEAERVGEKKK